MSCGWLRWVQLGLYAGPVRLASHRTPFSGPSEEDEPATVSNEGAASWEIVLETIDSTEVAVVKSLFDAAGIPYLIRGEDQFDAFRGAFRGTVFSPAARPATFLVPPDVAEDARALLKH